MTQITRKTRLCSAAGGILDIVDFDGEVIGEIAVPAGAVAASQYLELVPDGATLRLGEGLTALNPRCMVGIQAHPKGRETGANPDYQPTSASRFEREMRVTLSRLTAANRTLAARQKALESIERVPQAPAEVPPVEDEAPEVVEDGEGEGVE